MLAGKLLGCLPSRQCSAAQRRRTAFVEPPHHCSTSRNSVLPRAASSEHCGHDELPASRRRLLLALLAGAAFATPVLGGRPAAADPSAAAPSSSAPPASRNGAAPGATPDGTAGPSAPAGPSSSGAAPPAASTNGAGAPGTASPSPTTVTPLDNVTLTQEAERRLLAEEEDRRKRRKKQGRLRELEEIRIQLAEKELALLEKEKELLQKEQTLTVLTEELEVERKLRALLTKEKERAEEEAALAMGLCTGGLMLP